MVEDPMPGKPFQSCLIPYRSEIESLREQRPPVSYAQIAVLLRERHGLDIQRAAIAKFIKVRSGGRKVYYFRRELAAKPSFSSQSAAKVINPKPDPTPKPKFEFQYSERYSLTRLPPEEAAERRKKLEAEGH
jgi:hypothetical protein